LFKIQNIKLPRVIHSNNTDNGGSGDAFTQKQTSTKPLTPFYFCPAGTALS